MNWVKLCTMSLLIALLATTGAYAGQGATPTAWGAVSPTFGPGGLGFPKGKMAIGGNLLYGQSNGLRKYSDRLNGKVKANKMNEIVKVRYGIIDGLDIRTATPVYNVHLDKSTAADREVYGVGDTTALLHQVIFSQKKGDPLSLAVDLGGILPTASVSEHSSDAAGNCATGLMGGIGATYFYGANRFDAEVNYAMFSEGAHDYEKGDRFRFNAGYAYALTDQWAVGAESTLEIGQSSQYDGDVQNDAYTEWYVGPKVTFKYKPWNTNFGLVVQAPVNRWYEGTKAASDDLRVSFKVMKTFDFNGLFD